MDGSSPPSPTASPRGCTVVVGDIKVGETVLYSPSHHSSIFPSVPIDQSISQTAIRIQSFFVMKFTAFSLAAFAALASSSAIDVNKRASDLEVTLEAIGNSKVKASVTNNAAQAYNLFYKGSFLDSAPVNKLVVSSSCRYPSLSHYIDTSLTDRSCEGRLHRCPPPCLHGRCCPDC